MPAIIVHHNVSKSAAHWLASTKRKEFFGTHGATNIRTFVDPTDVPKLGALNQAMQASAAADAMPFDGVAPEPLVTLVEF